MSESTRGEPAASAARAGDPRSLNRLIWSNVREAFRDRLSDLEDALTVLADQVADWQERIGDLEDVLTRRPRTRLRGAALR